MTVGRHVVHFFFQSQSVALGGLISSLTGIGIVLAGGLSAIRLFVPIRRGERRRAQTSQAVGGAQFCPKENDHR